MPLGHLFFPRRRVVLFLKEVGIPRCWRLFKYLLHLLPLLLLVLADNESRLCLLRLCHLQVFFCIICGSLLSQLPQLSVSRVSPFHLLELALILFFPPLSCLITVKSFQLRSFTTRLSSAIETACHLSI